MKRSRSLFLCLLYSFASIVTAQVGYWTSLNNIDLIARSLEERQGNRGILPDAIIDLAQSFAPRELLLQTADNFTITCVDCSLSGKYKVRLGSNPDPNLLKELSTAVKSTPAAVASGANGVIDGVASSLPAKVSEIVDNVKNAIDQILPFDKRQNSAPQDIGSLLQKLICSLSVSVEQIESVKSNFNLEYSSGNSAVAFQFPNPTQPVTFSNSKLGPLDGLPEVQLGPIRIGFQILPLGFSTAISLAPGINVTFPFGADLSTKQPLLLGSKVVQDPQASLSASFKTPILNKFDPTLCFTGAVGPSINLVISEATSKSEARIGANIELPKASFCLSGKSNVDTQCKSPGPIQNAIEINSNVIIGVSTQAIVQVGGKMIPGIPELPSLATSFPILDQCFDIDGFQGTDSSISTAIPLPVSNFSTSIATATFSTTASNVLKASSTTRTSSVVSMSNPARTTKPSVNNDQSMALAGPDEGAAATQSMSTSAQPASFSTTSRPATTGSWSIYYPSHSISDKLATETGSQTFNPAAMTVTVTATVTQTVSVSNDQSVTCSCPTTSAMNPGPSASCEAGPGPGPGYQGNNGSGGMVGFFDQPVGVVFVIPITDMSSLSANAVATGAVGSKSTSSPSTTTSAYAIPTK